MASASENYTSLCDAGNSVLVIIDIQTELTAVMPAKVLARLQRNTWLLINTAVKLALPVFATERSPDGLGIMEPEISKLLPPTAKLYEKPRFPVRAPTILPRPDFNKEEAGHTGRHGSTCLCVTDCA